MGNKKGYWAGTKNPKYRHGYSHKLKAYQVWCDMMKRCHNPKAGNYHRYGGRGILVDERWHIFENFYADMGNPPPKHSIERENNNLGYSKQNCIWADALTQSNNRNCCVYITHNGETHTMAEWSSILGIAFTTIRGRLNKGWPVELVLSKAKHRWPDFVRGGSNEAEEA